MPYVRNEAIDDIATDDVSGIGQAHDYVSFFTNGNMIVY